MSVLLGEPGRPIWPVWEMLKHMFGKSDHTTAAIGKFVFFDTWIVRATQSTYNTTKYFILDIFSCNKM